MGSPLTAGSTVQCGHFGDVAVTSSAKLTVAGQAVLVATGIAGHAVSKCKTPAAPGSKLCSSVLSVLPASLATRLTAGGMGVVLDSLAGSTDGNPPGTLLGIAGQAKLTAV